MLRLPEADASGRRVRTNNSFVREVPTRIRARKTLPACKTKERAAHEAARSFGSYVPLREDHNDWSLDDKSLWTTSALGLATSRAPDVADGYRPRPGPAHAHAYC